MDPFSSVDAGWEPAIVAILSRARRLTGDEIVRLARAYLDPVIGDVDRTRVLAIARSRADRPVEVRALERHVAASLGSSLPSGSAHALRRLGLMSVAERAVTDAALAVLLHDRLGRPAFEAISRPWSDVR